MPTSDGGTGDDSFDAILRDVARAPAVRLADLDLSGRALGRFEVRRRIGAGGMGAVYEAWDTRLRRAVALKVLHAWKDGGGAAADRLVAEARRAAAVSHPNIAAVYDVDTIDGVTFMAEERVDGRSLDAILASTGVPVEEAIRIARRIVSALARAHRAGIVHRDLTPANVMIGRGGVVKLLDFGIATASAPPGDPRPAEARRETRPTGTPGYMAPEQAAGGPVDARSDVFSFGMLLRAMIASRPRADEPAIVRAARRLCDRCTERDPADRPADGAALAAALRSIARDAQPVAPPRWVARAIGAGVALAAALTIALAAGRAPHTRFAGDPGDRPSIAGGASIAALDAGAAAPAFPRRARAVEPARGDPADEIPARDPEAIGLPAELARDPRAAAAPSESDDPPGPARAPLPVIVYVDGSGRLVTIADLRGVDARRAPAIGGVILRAASGSARAGSEAEPVHGTLDVAAGPRGELRITLEIEPPGPTVASAEEAVAGLDDQGGAEPQSPNGVRSPGGYMGLDGGSVLTKGVDIGVASAEGPNARRWIVSLCGVPSSDTLILRVSGAGEIEIARAAAGDPALDTMLAVLDAEGGMLRAAPGVVACSPDSDP